MTSPRDDDPIGSLWYRVVRLPPAQQLDLFARLGDYLDDRPAKPSPLYANAKARARALNDLRRVCAELRRDPKMGITTREYDVVARRNGLLLSGAVVRAYNGWENAEAVLMGEQIPRTPQQNANRRAARRWHTRAERLEMVRRFLQSGASDLSRRAYNDWADAENAKGDSGAERLVCANAIQQGSGGLRWPEIIGAARLCEPVALPDAAYPLFVSIGMVASLTGESQLVERRREFPQPVADSGNGRVWLRDDIIAYRDNDAVPKRAGGCPIARRS